MNWFDKHYRYLCGLFIMIFLFAGLLTSMWGVYSSNIVYKSAQNVRYAYYWMQPKFVFIQATNNMLFLGSFISCGFGILLKNTPNKKSGEVLIICNIFNSLVCIFSTWIYLLIAHKNISPTSDFNIFTKSLQAFIGFYLYICFWSFLGYKLRSVIGSKLLSIIILFFEQALELFVIPRYGLFFLLQYLPTTLSRELVIKQFPFWIEGTWVNSLEVFSYANVTPVLGDNFMPKNINLVWIYSILVLYLAFLSIILIIKRRKVEKL